MRVGDKHLLLVGDRLLIKPDEGEERTKVGLYLPQSVTEKEPVRSGRVVEVGPGIALPNLMADSTEPWQRERESPVRYIPPQVEVGDYVLFQRKESVEVRYKEDVLLVIPQNAVLLIVRDEEGV